MVRQSESRGHIYIYTMGGGVGGAALHNKQQAPDTLGCFDRPEQNR